MRRRFARDPARLLLLGVTPVALYGAVFGSLYDQRLLTLAGVYVIMVLGYQFIFGHGGALSLAQGTFFGLGAYVTAILGAQLDQGFLVTFPASIVLPALLAAAVAVPILRLETHYLALATLALSQAVLLLAINAEGLTGGANGLPGIPGIVIFGATVGRGGSLLALVWAFVAVAALLAWQLFRGLYGQGYTIVRATPLVAGTLGIDTGTRRFTAFVLSAGYAGAAGALYAHTIRVVSPETLGFGIMVICLTMTVIGGRTQLAGAFLGALLLTHLPEWFRPLEQYYLIANGAVLLLAVLFAPMGLAGLASRRRDPETQSEARPDAEQASPHRALAGDDTSALLDAAGLARSYGGVRALAGADLRLDEGEIVGLIGPNGSGKTTLANLISGLDHPDAGTIRIAGVDTTRLAPHRIARLGLARSFQTPELPPDTTVLDAIAVARSVTENATLAQAFLATGADPALQRARSAALEILADADLASLASTNCDGLPHGLRRRVDVARALATSPRLLLLDEPAAGLTVEDAEALADQIRRAAHRGVAVLIIEHDTEFLFPLVDRVICLDQGRIIATGSAAVITADPAVQAAYFGAAA